MAEVPPALHEQPVYIDPPSAPAPPLPAAANAQPTQTKAPSPARVNHFPETLRYLYFMRFSLFLWGSMPLLAFADRFSYGAASITRGILTPFNGWQWIITGFIVVLPGWFALLAARIVCAYGPARFGSPPPPFFVVHNRMEAGVFWGAQVPALILLTRIAANSHSEEYLSYPVVIALLAVGAALALVFWYLIAILYYWTYVPDDDNPALAFLVPTWSKLHLDKIEKLEPTPVIHLFRWFVGWLSRRGDGYSARGEAAPGHIVATIALACAVILYFIFMPLSAPSPLPVLTLWIRSLSSALGLYVLYGFLRPALHVLVRKRDMPRSARLLPLLASVLLLCVVVLGIWQPAAPRVIPVIGYLVVLLVVLFWGLAGVAFFADRFRAPIFTTVAVVLLVVNLWPAEHVFPVNPIDKASPDVQAALPNPQAFLEQYAGKDPDHPRPLIVVTATGGGIHAAAWTAAALNELDLQFKSLNFHNHLLLLSTVSGGSVGAMGFLREYHAPQPFTQTSYERIQQGAGCSSLQAVAWGVAYPDTMRLIAPFLFNLFSSFDSYDRGWALQSALERNLHDIECIPNQSALGQSVPDASRISLNTLAKTFQGIDKLPLGDPDRHFPAFTFNTTAVETGDRFLLSNYSAFARPPMAGQGAPPHGAAPLQAEVQSAVDQLLPAGSFLGIYARKPILPIDSANPSQLPQEGLSRGGYADISLLTAARLSATFTYISPATRLPFEYAEAGKQNAFHFVDGGYYDNDGVNSAIEFLNTAFQPTNAKSAPNAKGYILFIEIRNDPDIDQTDSPDSYRHQAGFIHNSKNLNTGMEDDETPKSQRMGPAGQLLAPPLVALRSGFSSVTRRNRRELNTLIKALSERVTFDHVVLDYHPVQAEKDRQADKLNSELDQPLSWHLTARQRRWIEGQTTQAEASKDKVSPEMSAKQTRPGWLDNLIDRWRTDPADSGKSAMERPGDGQDIRSDRAKIIDAVNGFRGACEKRGLDAQTCEPLPLRSGKP